MDPGAGQLGLNLLRDLLDGLTVSVPGGPFGTSVDGLCCKGRKQGESVHTKNAMRLTWALIGMERVGEQTEGQGKTTRVCIFVIH